MCVNINYIEIYTVCLQACVCVCADLYRWIEREKEKQRQSGEREVFRYVIKRVG